MIFIEELVKNKIKLKLLNILESFRNRKIFVYKDYFAFL